MSSALCVGWGLEVAAPIAPNLGTTILIVLFALWKLCTLFYLWRNVLRRQPSQNLTVRWRADEAALIS